MVIKTSDIIRKDSSENYSENINPVIVKELERVEFVKNIKDQVRTLKNIFLKSLVIFREELIKYYYKKITI